MGGSNTGWALVLLMTLVFGKVLMLTYIAVAAAVFGDASKVEYVPTTSKVRFTVLQSGEIDMLSRNTTFDFIKRR